MIWKHMTVNLTAVVLILGLAQAALAEELKEGTVIDASNLDTVLNDTFEGRKVSDLILPRVQWLIKEWNLKITLDRSRDIPLPERIVLATEKYSGQPSITPNRMLENYRAGVPFPDIDPDDPQAGAKIVWNHINGRPRNGDGSSGHDALVLIDAVSGGARVQRWYYSRWFGTGRIMDAGEPRVDPPVIYKELLFATYPHDIKGLGTLTIRWNRPEFDAIWAYIRTVRRVRRLSGGAWLDPVGGTDFLRDDIEFNALPAWYEGFKVLGKTTTLQMTYPAGAETLDRKAYRAFVPEGNTLAEMMPHHDIANRPHWNPKQRWQPREVWVVDSVTPLEHPYGRKITYFDAENWNFYGTEIYDRKGDFWKWQMQSFGPLPSDDGYVTRDGKPELWFVVTADHMYDFQRMHGTIYAAELVSRTINEPLREEDMSITQLEAAGR